jgi:hypothetical protein
MTTIRAQVILKTFTNVPADYASNTWHFSTVSGLTTALASDIVADLAAFYVAISSKLSPVISSTTEVKLFNLDDPVPRQPFEPGWGFTLGGRSAGGIAEEVALVLSSHAALPHTARRRGRVFLGPLGTSAIDNSTSSAWSKVNAATITAVKNAAIALRDSPTAPAWTVYSPTANLASDVTGGWVDDSPDTQRRRGHKASSRNIW